jgi:uncharacterized protein
MEAFYDRLTDADPLEPVEQRLTRLQGLAVMGMPGAASALGRTLDINEGDPDAALDWYRLGATQGDPDAALALGTALMDDGIAPDPESAERWLTFAAERGEDLAWAGLGELYENGALDGVPDHQTAREMYERGAAMGEATSLWHLARHYLYGLTCEPDASCAYFLLLLAHRAGHPQAPDACARLALSLSHGTIAAAQRMARAWKPQTN